ncbi:MAG: CaiB/BaiF CoA transferase family protein [Myxococcaceae bacterium]
MGAQSLPLSDLRVLDLSRLLPGPYATLVLADLGAQVDKLEDPEGGDYIRQMPPLVGDESALFYALNRNKRSITLDLKKPAGVAALRRLIPRYDVLVESLRPGVMERLGLAYHTLAFDNPRLIYCSISGYGQTGPDRLKAGHDLNYISRAGLLGYSGTAQTPGVPGFQVADVGGGSLFSLVGILAALHERDRTGQGRFLDISMTDGALAFLHMQLSARLLTRPDGPPLSRGADALNGGYGCYRVYATQDGKHLAVGALEPKFFAGVCQQLGHPELVEVAYASGEQGQDAQRKLEALFREKTLAQWQELFAKSDVCVTPVLEGDAVFDDPQLTARGMFVAAHDAVRKRDVTHLRTPLQFGALPTQPPPTLGQHTEEILIEAGFTPEERRFL